MALVRGDVTHSASSGIFCSTNLLRSLDACRSSAVVHALVVAYDDLWVSVHDLLYSLQQSRLTSGIVRAYSQA